MNIRLISRRANIFILLTGSRAILIIKSKLLRISVQNKKDKKNKAHKWFIDLEYEKKEWRETATIEKLKL